MHEMYIDLVCGLTGYKRNEESNNTPVKELNARNSASERHSESSA